MPRCVYLTTLVLLGCATAQQSSLPSGTTRTHTVYQSDTKTYDIVQNETPDVLTQTVPASLDAAWAALSATYGDVGIPVNAIDPASHMIGSGPTRAHGKFAGTRLSKLIDCGASSFSGSKADYYTVMLNVRTQLKPAASGGGTTVQTLVEATARDAGTSTDPVRCSTTGILEHRIVTVLGMRATAK